MTLILDSTTTLATYTGNGNVSFTGSGSFAIGTGTHTFTVNADDTSGNHYQSSVTFSVISTGGMSLIAPGNSAQITSLVPFKATVNSNNGTDITAMKAYLDFQTNPIATFTINTPNSTTFTGTGTFIASAGSHVVSVNAWDQGGALYQSSASFTMLSSGGIVVNNPAQSSAVSSPVAFSASATSTSGHVVTTMKTYIDFSDTEQATYTGTSTTLTASDSYTNIANGPNTLIVNAWDSGGALYQEAVDFSVNSSTFVVVPSNATTFNNMDDTPGTGDPWSAWQPCSVTNPPCGGQAPGGLATVHTFNQVSDPTAPDGVARDFAITAQSGSGFSSYLWFTNFPNITPTATNWLMDYYIKVTDPGNSGSIELDGNQTGSGVNYVVGTECNYGANPLPGNPHIWRFWDGSRPAPLSGEGWNYVYDNQNPLPCPLSTVGHWYHVQMYFTLNLTAKTYTLEKIRVTDTSTSPASIVQDQIMGSSRATFHQATASHNNGLDIQLDGTNGKSYSATYDKLTISRW